MPRVFAPRDYYEIVGAGFKSPDTTPEQLLWVHGTQMDVMGACLGTGASWTKLPSGHVPEYDEHLDFALPAEFSELRAKLLSFKERV